MPPTKVTAFVAFFIYLLFLLWILFFQVGATDRGAHFNERKIHLFPLQNTYKNVRKIIANDFGAEDPSGFTLLTAINIFGNIILFIPLGFLLPLIKKRTDTKKILFISASISCMAELIQYCLMIGVFDIDDIILNIGGGVCGIALQKIFFKSHAEVGHRR